MQTFFAAAADMLTNALSPSSATASDAQAETAQTSKNEQPMVSVSALLSAVRDSPVAPQAPPSNNATAEAAAAAFSTGDLARFHVHGGFAAHTAQARNAAVPAPVPSYLSDLRQYGCLDGEYALRTGSRTRPTTDQAAPDEGGEQEEGAQQRSQAALGELPEPLQMSAVEGEFQWKMVFVDVDPKYKTVSLPDSGEQTINTLRSSNKNFNFNGWHAVRLQCTDGGGVQPFKGGEMVQLRVWELPSTPNEIEAGQGSALEPELLVQDVSHFFKKTGSIYFGAPRFVKPGRYRIELQFRPRRQCTRGAVQPIIISYRARDPSYEKQIAELMSRITAQEASAAANLAQARRLGGEGGAAARAAAAADSHLHKELMARLTSGSLLNKKLQAKLARDAARRAGMASAAGANASKLSKVQLEVLASLHLPHDPPAEVAKAAAQRVGCDLRSVQLALESEEAREQRLAEERARRLLGKLAERKEAEAALVTAAARRKPSGPMRLVSRGGAKAAERSWSKRNAAQVAWEKQQHAIEDGQVKVIQPGPDGQGHVPPPVALVLASRRQVPLLRRPGKLAARRHRRQRFENICAGETAVVWCAQLAAADVTGMLLESRTFQIAHEKQLEAAAAADAAAAAAAAQGSTCPAVSPSSAGEDGPAPPPSPPVADSSIRRSRRGRHVKLDASMGVSRGPVTAKDTLAGMKRFLTKGGLPAWGALAGQVAPRPTGHKPADDSDSDSDGGFASPMRSPGLLSAGSAASAPTAVQGRIGSAALPLKQGTVARSAKRPRDNTVVAAEGSSAPVSGARAVKSARRELAAEGGQGGGDSPDALAALHAAQRVQHHLAPEQHMSPAEYGAAVASSITQ